MQQKRWYSLHPQYSEPLPSRHVSIAQSKAKIRLLVPNEPKLWARLKAITASESGCLFPQFLTGTRISARFTTPQLPPSYSVASFWCSSISNYTQKEAKAMEANWWTCSTPPKQYHCLDAHTGRGSLGIFCHRMPLFLQGHKAPLGVQDLCKTSNSIHFNGCD